MTNEFNDAPQVLISNLTSRKSVHFVKIKLVGTRSNGDGLGATVRVRAGGRVLTQSHDGKSGHLAALFWTGGGYSGRVRGSVMARGRHSDRLKGLTGERPLDDYGAEARRVARMPERGRLRRFIVRQAQRWAKS